VAFCFSGAASALLPPAASHAGALLRMSGKGRGLPFLPRPRCSRTRRKPEQHSPQLYNTCALLLGPESIARLEMGRCPSPITQLSNQSQLNISGHPTRRTNQSHLNIQTHPTRTARSITT